MCVGVSGSVCVCECVCVCVTWGKGEAEALGCLQDSQHHMKHTPFFRTSLLFTGTHTHTPTHMHTHTHTHAHTHTCRHTHALVELIHIATQSDGLLIPALAHLRDSTHNALQGVCFVFRRVSRTNHPTAS